MALTPEEIRSRQFLVSLRGYDREEVQAYLTRVAEHVAALEERLAQLEESSASASPGETVTPAAARDESAVFAEIGQQTQRILETAQEAGAQMRASAQEEADRHLAEAREQAAGIEAEGQRRREEIEAVIAGLEQSRSALAGDLRGVRASIDEVLTRYLPQVEPDAPDQPDAPGVQDEHATAEPRLDGIDPDARAADATEEAHADPFGLRRKALQPLRSHLVRRIKRTIVDLQNHTMTRIRRGGDELSLDGVLPTQTDLSSLDPIATQALDRAWLAGAEAAGLLVGRPLDPPPPDPELPGDLVADGLDRVRSALQSGLETGLAAGETASALSRRARDVFGQLRRTTAEELADNHLVRAYELGLLETCRAAGIGRREWRLSGEPRCANGRCGANELVGPLAVAEQFPSGHDVPPVHVACACATLPILEPQ